MHYGTHVFRWKPDGQPVSEFKRTIEFRFVRSNVRHAFQIRMGRVRDHRSFGRKTKNRVHTRQMTLMYAYSNIHMGVDVEFLRTFKRTFVCSQPRRPRTTFTAESAAAARRTT